MKRTMKNIVKPGSITLGFGLMLTTLCYGQAVSYSTYTGPSHNVIYWDGDPNTVQTLASSAYTDVILGFLLPDQNCNLYWEGGMPGSTPAGLANMIQTLHNTGKTVLVSLGGSDAQSSSYAACANSNMRFLEIQLNNIVTGNSTIGPQGAAFDGLDIDFEDTAAFNSGSAYDGVNFLTQLTNDLSTGGPAALPQWSIITHAPQPPYWTQNYQYQNPPYAQIFWNTNNNISWFNNQTYNNCLTGNLQWIAMHSRR